MRALFANFANAAAIRLTKNGLAYVFKEGRLGTISGGDLEHNKFLGQIFTKMRVLTSKDGDLLSQFDDINEEVGADEDATSDNISSTWQNVY